MKRIRLVLSIIPLLALASCGAKAPKTSEIAKDAFSITSTSNTYYLNNTDAKQIKLSVSNDSVLNEHDLKDLQYSIVTNSCDASIKKIDNDYYVSATSIGEVTIEASIKELKSSNSLTIIAKYDDTTVANFLEEVLDTEGGVVFGESYNIGIAAAETSSYSLTGADGILRIDSEGKLEVCGIGQGRIKLLKGDATVFDGRFTVYNSILATKIKEDLISQGKIESKSDSVPNPLLANIKTLDMSGELINDPSASFGIKYLTQLVTLNLSDNNLNDASFISTISTLKNLDLSNNNFDDISSIIDNENLQHLDLSNNNLTKITKLQYLYKIKYLDLSNNRITDVSPLSSSYSLESLFLNNNEVTNFKDSLSGLEYLTELGVGNCGISFTDIISLRYLPNITYLDISGTNPSLENLASLTKLKKLILSECQLNGKNLTQLNNLRNLEYLDVSKNSLTTETYSNALNPANLSKLSTLVLGGNEFDVIPSLSAFTNLEVLDLTNSYNLTSVASLYDLPIKELILDDSNSIDVSDNGVEFKGMINSLTNMEKLSILSGFNYINEDLYSFLTQQVEDGAFKLRFLDGDYVDANTIYNFKQSVIFGISSFLSHFNPGTDGSRLVGSLGNAKQVILSLVNDDSAAAYATYKFDILKTLSRLDIYGNVYKTYDMRFEVLDRKESSFIFAFHDFKDVLSTNNSVIKAADGSKVRIYSYGVSYLENKGFASDDKVRSNPGHVEATVKAYDVYVSNIDGNKTASLSIIGGLGQSCSKAKNGSGSNYGDRGSKGGTGGNAIECHNCTLLSGGLVIKGGNGGNGGEGGESKMGGIKISEKGVKGGDGGNGGNGIVYTAAYITYKTNQISGGEGGSGGKGGAWNGEWAIDCEPGDTGNAGSDGSPVVKS